METQASPPKTPGFSQQPAKLGSSLCLRSGGSQGTRELGSTRPVQLEAQPLPIPRQGPSFWGPSSKPKPLRISGGGDFRDIYLPPPSFYRFPGVGMGVLPGKQGGVSNSRIPSSQPAGRNVPPA